MRGSAIRALWRHKLGLLGFILLAALILVAVFASEVAPYDPLNQDIPDRLLPPGDVHWFGTDTFGRDVFSRVVHGARVSLMVGLTSVMAGVVLGTAAGMASAYGGGRLDLALQRLVDTLLAFPTLVLALILVAAVGPSLATVIVAVVAAFTPQITRIARAQTLVVKEEGYVTAARAMGAGPGRILLRHVLPNSVAPVIVHATGFMEGAVIAEAALSFLGLGVPPPQPSWGRMLQEGASGGYLEAAPWLALFPGLALSLLVISVALIGDALRDALDPRLR